MPFLQHFKLQFGIVPIRQRIWKESSSCGRCREAGKGCRVNHNNRNAASISHYVCTKNNNNNNNSNRAIKRGNWQTITSSVSGRRKWRRERSRKGSKLGAGQGQLGIGVGHVIDIHAWSGQSAGCQCGRGEGGGLLVGVAGS